MSATISRAHSDTTSTGALDANSDGGTPDPTIFTSGNITGRIQIVSHWHDSLDRVTTTGFYGSNGGSTFDRDGLAEPGSSSASVLVTKTSYNDDGTALDMTDAIGTKTRTLYDDAGRQVAVIRNYVNGTPSGATGADDLYTRYVYEDGLRTAMWVDIDGDDDDSDSDDQVTTWIYGSKNGTAGSEIYSNRLVRAIKYPDTTNAGATAAAIDSDDSDVVSFAWNAQGEQIKRKDQAGNVIETTFDGSGRPAARKATTVATGAGFDASIERIATAYDSLGRVSTVTQYDDPSAGTVQDQVKFTYDGWGSVTKVEQDHDSIVGGAGVTDYEVSYTYSKNATTGERQTIKRTGMTMPGGQSIVYGYGAGGSIADSLSRVSFVQIGAGNGTVVAVYSYLGAAKLVGTDLPEPDVFSNLYTGASAYGNLDRFNRVTSSIWTKDLATDRDFYDVDITYDAAGNITHLVDNVMQLTSGTDDHRFDSLYTIDALGRLTRQERGNWTGSAVNNDQETRDWLLSQTGNWAERKIDYDASGTYTGSDLNEDNPVTGGSAHFTLANEWIARDIDDDGADDYTLTYDAAGNMTSDGKDYDYTYDAFGRLVDIANRISDSSIKAYRYNGMGWRITDYDGTTTEHLVYNDRWQLLARYDGANVREQWLPHAAGLDGRGGSSYIDSVILRTTYTGSGQSVVEDKRFYYAQNWRADVSVILDDSGVQQERVAYSPYGQPFGIAAGDTDFDGDHDSSDDTAITGWTGAFKPYRAYADVNLDGSINSSDASAADADSLGWNVLTSDDVLNRIGQAGSVSDRATSHYHGRGFVYSFFLARTQQRRTAAMNGPGQGGGVGFFPCYSPCCVIVPDRAGRLGECDPDPSPPASYWCADETSDHASCTMCCEETAMRLGLPPEWVEKCKGHCDTAWPNPNPPPPDPNNPCQSEEQCCACLLFGEDRGFGQQCGAKTLSVMCERIKTPFPSFRNQKGFCAQAEASKQWSGGVGNSNYEACCAYLNGGSPSRLTPGDKAEIDSLVGLCSKGCRSAHPWPDPGAPQWVVKCGREQPWLAPPNCTKVGECGGDCYWRCERQP